MTCLWSVFMFYHVYVYIFNFEIYLGNLFMALGCILLLYDLSIVCIFHLDLFQPSTAKASFYHTLLQISLKIKSLQLGEKTQRPTL